MALRRTFATLNESLAIFEGGKVDADSARERFVARVGIYHTVSLLFRLGCDILV